jgi:hypothetical protein
MSKCGKTIFAGGAGSVKHSGRNKSKGLRNKRSKKSLKARQAVADRAARRESTKKKSYGNDY